LHGHSPPGHYPQTSPLDNFPPYLGHSPAVKAKILKLAVTRISDPNRSTSIKVVHVNGRLLYIVDRYMVVVEGKVTYTLCKKRQGKLSRSGKCPGEYVRGNMSKGGMSGSRYCSSVGLWDDEQEAQLVLG